MIASVRGRVAGLGLDAAVVELGGFGVRVRATPRTLARLRPGDEAALATSLVVREDSLTLYGFADDDERDAFEVLQTVSGVGPRLALAMLAVHTPDALRLAVATEDLAALTRVPGIGRKGAQRIVLEIGDRLGPALEAGAGSAPAGGGAPAASGHERVVEALTGLGWPVKAAGEAVAAVTAEGGPAAGAGGDVAAVLRAALRHLGGGA